MFSTLVALWVKQTDSEIVMDPTGVDQDDNDDSPQVRNFH